MVIALQLTRMLSLFLRMDLSLSKVLVDLSLPLLRVQVGLLLAKKQKDLELLTMVLRRLDHPRVDILVKKLNPLDMGLQGIDLHMVMEMDPNAGKLRPVKGQLLAFHLPLNLGQPS